MNLRERLVTFFAIFMVLVGPVAALGDEGNKLYVKNTNPEFVINDPANPANTYTIEVLVQGPNPGSISIDFVDYLASDSGRKVLPGGTVPNSLKFAIQLQAIDLTYIPNGKTQVFNLKFEPKPGLQPRIYSGGLKIGFQGLDQAAGVNASNVGVTKNLMVTPYGGATDLVGDQIVAATVTRFEVQPLQRSSIIDSLLPDIPGVVNYGPIASEVTVENSGDFPVFISMSWAFLQNSELLATKRLEDELLGGGLESSKRVETLLEDSATQRRINVMPSIGFVTIEFQLTSSLTGVSLEPVNLSKTVFYFQWKELTVAIAAAMLLLWLALKYRARFRNRRTLSSADGT